ncbi:MAG: phosphatase PAP2 family protein [Novosphingobium sp.]|nr:phosphatase PAP2 family protein [Novosphingobium sp.]
MDRTATRNTGLLVASVASLLCFALVAAWQASGASASFDRAGLLYWREMPLLFPVGPAWLTQAMQGLTIMGGGPFRIALGLFVLTLLLARRHIRESLMLLAIMIPAAAINSGLKLLFARPRPDIVPRLDGFSDLSFPSGHSFNGAATYLGLALIMAGLRSRTRYWLVVPALCLSLAIAFSRVWLGVHYPTDAIAGWLGGTGWATMVAYLMQPRASRD